jgi:hypothetical protein
MQQGKFSLRDTKPKISAFAIMDGPKDCLDLERTHAVFRAFSAFPDS